MTKKIKVCCERMNYQIECGNVKLNAAGVKILFNDQFIDFCPWCPAKIELEEEKPKVKKRWYAKAYGKSENPTDAFFLLFRDNCDSIYRRYKAGEEHKLKLEPETNRLYIETDSE